MERDYALIDDLSSLLGTIRPESIVSRTFFKGDCLKALLFGFSAGQELSEHTSNQAAIIQIIQGEATVTVGDDLHELKAGSWLHMPPHLKHSVYARTTLLMLLTMYQSS